MRKRRARAEDAPARVEKNVLQTHCVMLEKSRFPTFEVAAQWVEKQMFSLRKHEDRKDHFVFIQIERDLFKQETLHTVRLSDGVDAVVGQLSDGQAPVIAGQDPVKPEEQLSEMETKLDLADNSAFQELQDLLANGYEILNDAQVKTLRDGLKDEFKKDMQELAEAIDELLPFLELVDMAELNDAQADVHDKMMEALSKLEEVLPKLVKKSTEWTPVEKFAGLDLGATVEILTEVEKGLEWKKTLKRGGTPKQVALAKRLVETTKFTAEDVQKCAEFQEKHKNNRGFNDDGSPTDGEIAWALHGGDPGAALVEDLLKALEEKEKAHCRTRRLKVVKALGHAAEAFGTFNGTSFENLTLVLKCAVVSMGRFLDMDKSEEVVEKKAEKLVEKTKNVRVTKNLDEEQRTVLGIVLEPDVADLHGDTMDAETIRKTAHQYMEDFQNIKLMHDKPVNDKVHVVESYLAPVDFTLESSDGSMMKIKKGTWLLKVRILDNVIWEDVKSGKLTGFSMGGIAVVHDLREENK